jgi:hypothetical protein
MQTAMRKTCPHCQATLPPGGPPSRWCSECGNVLDQLPEGAGSLFPSGLPGRAAGNLAAWRWVKLGLQLKLAALVFGAGAVLVAAFTPKANAMNVDAEVVIACVMLAAVPLDIVGLLLCLATPKATVSRRPIIASVGCQLFVVFLAFCAPPAALLAQFLTAFTFAIYLL